MVKGSKKMKDMGYVSKRKALDCNKDLEWSPGTTIVFHKRSGKPYTGTCVAYYDNRKLERKTNFILGKENGVLLGFCVGIPCVAFACWKLYIDNWRDDED